MTLLLETPTLPLRIDDNGVIRIGETRIPIDRVVYAFHQGYTPEEIISEYDSLELAGVYAVISYYLENQTEIDKYIQSREQEAEIIRAEFESRPDYQLFRKRLLARKAKLDLSD